MLEFFEQPDVLDGDHRLVGEGFKQLDLNRGEWAHLQSDVRSVSNKFPMLSKGSGQEGANSHRNLPNSREIFLHANIGNVESAMLAASTAYSGAHQ